MLLRFDMGCLNIRQYLQYKYWLVTYNLYVTVMLSATVTFQ